MAIAPLNEGARFERLRGQAKQEVTAQTEQQKDALARRFAALGRGSSGAAIKSQAQVEQSGQEALQKRFEGIQNVQEQEQLRKQEVEEGRQFSRGEREASQLFGSEQAKLGREFSSTEREKGQGFAAQQAELQRKFASGEALTQREFAALEAAKGRDFSTKERLSSQDFAGMQAQLSRDLQSSQFGKQMDLALEQFALDKRVTEYNLEQAMKEDRKGEDDPLGAFFDPTRYEEILSPTDGWAKIKAVFSKI